MSEKSSFSGESNGNQLPNFLKNSRKGTDSVHEDTDQSIISVVEGEGHLSDKTGLSNFSTF